MKDCVFCQIVKGEIPARKVYEDDNFLAFLDQKPIAEGHTLLIPKKHHDYLFDADDEDYLLIMKLAKKLSEPIRKAFKAKRIGLVVEGFGVPHVHLHLIPINKVHQLDPNLQKRATDKELLLVSDKIIKEIKQSIL